MSGHSKWATTKRKKAKIDGARAKVWNRINKELTVASRMGGEDPEANPRLRLAVTKAKAANMPAKNIETAILKGAGKLEGVNYEELVYEGYGPNGIAIILECMTDNKNRTVGELRNLFAKNGGNLAQDGAVAWMFEQKGKVVVQAPNLTEDEATELAIEAGGEDVQLGDDAWEILTAPDDLAAVAKAVEAKGLTVSEAEFTRIPKNTSMIADEDAPKAMKLLDILDDHDDVQNLYSNVEFSEAAQAAME
ncbi:MAG TPA: YebC/PmpR family DNA-binding transcriptional regulator [Fibrobacteria bacterium]|nr:YebC/PmpR family DNA-binding transcriptional regulator [Fibrobacteria bacterium]